MTVPQSGSAPPWWGAGAVAAVVVPVRRHRGVAATHVVPVPGCAVAFTVAAGAGAVENRATRSPSPSRRSLSRQSPSRCHSLEAAAVAAWWWWWSRRSPLHCRVVAVVEVVTVGVLAANVVVEVGSHRCVVVVRW